MHGYSSTSRTQSLRAALLAAGLFALPALAQLQISEFMAVNTNGLQDLDGAFSDWIEIHNTSNAAVNLQGWFLTDSSNNLAQWAFPATNLPAGGYLVVFASGKDRTNAEFHANFSLSADGEYLALVRPDGTTVAQEFAPAYPPQYANVSYGLQTQGTNPTLRAGQPGFLIYHTPGAANSCLPAPHPAYSDDSVARIDLNMSDATWNWLMNSPWDDYFQSIDLRFRHGDIDITVTNVGIQCRGQTSRDKQPRSFNIAFDAFVPDQTLFGLERLNLNSDANDPSMARPKLINDIHNALGLPTAYANHAAVVISNTTSHYVFLDAVRNNTQPVDDVFLEQRFGNKRGNLYKCNHREWEATLEKRYPSVGSSYIGNGTTYELKYCGAGDASYNDLAAFVNLINDTPSNDFPNAIMNAFDVDTFLQRLALDVLTGNWDDYWSNGNNYHLFLDPDTHRWIYIPYDFDNALGVSWDSGAVNWATRSITNWPNFSGSTPLATRIMGVTEFKNRYRFYLKQILDSVYNLGLTNSVYHYRTAMTAALPFPDPAYVGNMKYAERDNYEHWGTWYWTYDHFWYSYDFPQYSQNWSLPSEYRDVAITNFIGVRRTSALAQLGTVPNIGPILSGFALVPAQPRSNDAVAVSIRAVDDVAVSNVVLYYSFQNGATNAAPMALQAGGAYAAVLPAFGATGTLRYVVRAADNTGKATFHPFGGSNYAASVEIAGAAPVLVVTELNYNPYDLTPAETNAGLTDPQNLEFIELHNAGNAALDLTGWKFTEGIGGTFPAFTLAAGEYAVAVKNTNQFRVRYTNTAIRVIGTFSGNLSNGGETVRLENAQSGVIAAIPYSDKGDWPGRADGDGSSLELVDPAGGYADPFNWRSSSEYGGSPGAAGLGPDNRVVINEVLTHTDPPLSDAIELHNPTAGAIAIGNWYLSDAKSNYRKYRIPAGTVLPAGGYIVFNETNHFNTSGGSNTNDFSLDGAHGEDVYLVQTDARTNLVRFVDHEEFGAAANGESFGRWPSGSGRLYPMQSRTFGAANSGPRTGPVILGEIMYQPPSGSNHLEFIEIANPGSNSESLARWQLAGGVTFTFTNGTLPAGGALVVLSFNPGAASNSARLAEFEAAYGVTGSVAYAGPFSGTLADAGERLRLLRPDSPPTNEPAFYPLLTEDEVAYSNDLPWAPEAAGGGASLERLLPAAWGDSYTSWAGLLPPSPGTLAAPQATFALTVVSPRGNPSPAAGEHLLYGGSPVSCFVSSPDTQGGTRYLCSGWTLAGHEPAAGSSNAVSLTLTNNATLTWLWETNYLLAAAAGPGGSVQPAGGWQSPGAVLELTATASNLYAFSGWTGDTNAIVSGTPASSNISVQMLGPVAVTAQFAAVVPTYYASPAGSHTAPYTNWNTAATSLPFIVNYAPAGSTILVAAATYPLSATLTLGKALHLKSASGPAATILDGEGAVRVLLLTNEQSVVEGFTLQRGNSGSSSGGGVRIDPAGVLVNCIIRSNATQKSGGGAALLGGGELRNCLVHGNTANLERGGGVYTYTAGTVPVIDSCTFAANSAGEGGGAYLYEPAVLRNSIVWGNAASSGSNLVTAGSGQTVTHTLAGPAPSGSANLGADPAFAGAGDYRLAPSSPALNAGTAQSWMAAARDLDNQPRVTYGTNDLGAYETLLPTVDSDADRVGDWQESRAGTDPFDPGSFLGIETALLAPQPGQFVLHWSSTTGRSYRINYSTNMVFPFEFTAYSNIPADPPDNTFTGWLTQPGAAYYRIEVE